MIPAQYVHLLVKTNKNDAIDAQAVYEAICPSTIGFVKIKTEQQQGMLLAYRVREQLMNKHTQAINIMHTLCGVWHGVPQRRLTSEETGAFDRRPGRCQNTRASVCIAVTVGQSAAYA